MFIEGDIYTRECCGKMMTRVTFNADDLCKNYTPHVNLFTFCLMHNLLRKIEGKDEYVPNIDLIILHESEDEKKNEMAREICKKYKIDIL